jgi:hypothetical protein
MGSPDSTLERRCKCLDTGGREVGDFGGEFFDGVDHGRKERAVLEGEVGVLALPHCFGNCGLHVLRGEASVGG